MCKYLSRVLLIVMVVSNALPSASGQSGKKQVDLIVFGGTIVTMDHSHMIIDDASVAVANGRIVAILRRKESALEVHAIRPDGARARCALRSVPKSGTSSRLPSYQKWVGGLAVRTFRRMRF